jgi:hypothetical protein
MLLTRTRMKPGAFSAGLLVLLFGTFLDGRALGTEFAARSNAILFGICASV